jgi:hypothetical protein
MDCRLKPWRPESVSTFFLAARLLDANTVPRTGLPPCPAPLNLNSLLAMDVFAQPYEAQIRIVPLQHPVAGTWYTSYDATVYPFGIVRPTQSLISDPGIFDDTYSFQQHPLHQGQKHHKARDFVAGLVRGFFLMA